MLKDNNEKDLDSFEKFPLENLDIKAIRKQRTALFQPTTIKIPVIIHIQVVKVVPKRVESRLLNTRHVKTQIRS